MARQWAINFLSDVQNQMQGGQILIGNATLPEIALAPYLNGFLFECFSGNWNTDFRPAYSAANWRQTLDLYLAMQRLVRQP